MKKNMIGVIGDMHMKDDLSYADNISDRRVSEKKSILDFIVESFKDCDHVVFLGDNFNSRNNSSETNREFVEFLERFNDKHLYIISGNHEKKGNGKTAIDFLGEIKKSNWHIFTKPGTVTLGIKNPSVGVSTAKKENLKLDFLPYMLNQELEVENTEEAVKKIIKNLEGGDILFAHHAISGTVFNGILTDTLKEIVLPEYDLKDEYKLIVAGHIHVPCQYGKILITGNVFTTEVGDKEKFIYKINTDLEIEKIKVPARPIGKIENPTEEQLSSIPNNAIVKVILTDKKVNLETLKEQLSRFDASLIIEDYPNERVKAHIEEGAFDFSIEAVLKLYAEQKKIDHEKLLKGLQLING
jgi:DNA repair exonuclease SbcCD nuclease subunit